MRTSVPSVFTLRFEETEGRYHVTWRKGQFVGAELASQEAPPGKMTENL
jgi:hypothetical protein